MRSSMVKSSALLLGALSGSIGFVLFYYYRKRKERLFIPHYWRTKVVVDFIEIPYAVYRDRNFRDVELEKISNETNTNVTFRQKSWPRSCMCAKIYGNDQGSVTACKNALLHLIDVMKDLYYETKVPCYKIKRLLGQRDYSLLSIMKISNTVMRINSDKTFLKKSAFEFKDERKTVNSSFFTVSVRGTKDNMDIAKHFLKVALANTFRTRIFPVTDKPLTVLVSACYNPVNFYVRIIDVERDKLQILNRRLRQSKHISDGDEIPDESFVVSKEVNNCCYRGLVIGKTAKDDEKCYQVLYTDIGIEASVPSSFLRLLRGNEGKLLFQAIRARLCVQDEHSWSQECIDFFKNICQYRRHNRLSAILKKYQIVDDEAVACLDLFNDECSITAELIKRGFARELSCG